MAYSEDHIALAAEYALGTLDADERAQVETMMAVDTEFTAMVRAWENRLGALFGGKEINQLDELELIIEIMLEPQLDPLVLAVIARQRIARGELLRDVGDRQAEFLGEILRPHDRQRLQQQTAGHGTVVQSIAPRQELRLDARCAQVRNGRVAIGDDESFRHQPRPR